MVRCSVLWRRSVDGLSIPPPPSKHADKVIELKYEELLMEAGEKQRADFVENAGVESLVAVTFGYTSGDSPVSISAGLVGYQVVWGVGDKCHFRMTWWVSGRWKMSLHPRELMYHRGRVLA